MKVERGGLTIEVGATVLSVGTDGGFWVVTGNTATASAYVMLAIAAVGGDAA